MFTARRIDGGEAADIGLANQAVDDAALDGAVEAMTTAIVANSWDTSRFDKAVLSDAEAMDRRQALDYEHSAPYGRPRDMAERLRSGTTKSG